MQFTHFGIGHRSSCMSLLRRVVKRASLFIARFSSLNLLCSSLSCQVCSSISLSFPSCTIICRHSCSNTCRSWALLSAESLHWASLRCCCWKKSCSSPCMLLLAPLNLSDPRWCRCCTLSGFFFLLLAPAWCSTSLLSSSSLSSSESSSEDLSPLNLFSFFLEWLGSDSRSCSMCLVLSVKIACNSSKNGHCLPLSGLDVSLPCREGAGWTVSNFCKFSEEKEMKLLIEGSLHEIYNDALKVYLLPEERIVEGVGTGPCISKLLQEES